MPLYRYGLTSTGAVLPSFRGSDKAELFTAGRKGLSGLEYVIHYTNSQVKEYFQAPILQCIVIILLITQVNI
jgi:hypothetical protein